MACSFRLRKKTSAIHAIAVIGIGLLLSLTITSHLSAQSLPSNFHGTASSSGSTGIEGTIPSPPPTTAATIAVPSGGQTFSSSGPVTVSGLCTTGDLVKVFSNGVFIGSVQCANGSYSLTVSLFGGQNQLSVGIYDALDQAGPSSNLTNVTLSLNTSTTTPSVLLTSGDAKIGSTPGSQFSWPITVSGGTAPYAISIDWGDNSSETLLSEKSAGTFLAQHTYAQAGVYTILVKASDQTGTVAYLQLVGVGNGPLSQVTSSSINGSSSGTSGKTVILWQPAALLIPFIVIAFWLGRKYELSYLRRHLNQADAE